MTVGVHLVNFVDHSGQFAHLTTVPAQFTISKTWHAASLTPHWRGGGLPPCEKRVTKTGKGPGQKNTGSQKLERHPGNRNAFEGEQGFPTALEGVNKRNTL